MSGTVKCGADDSDLSVHHSARRDNVCAGVGLSNRRFGVNLECLVIVDRAMPIKNSAVTVAGVFINTQVRHQHNAVTKV